MSKIIKNTTGSAIFVFNTGVDVPASGQYPIPQEDYIKWATDDTIAEITSDVNAGNLVVNDGSGDLSASDGLRYLEYPDRSTIELNGSAITKVTKIINFDGDVNAVDDGNGEITVTIGQAGIPTGKALEFEFSSSGTTIDKWLSTGHPSVASNEVPYVAEWSGKVIGYSLSNKNDNIDIDIKFYKNGTLQYTWEVRNKRTAYKVLQAGFFSVSQGDRLSVYASDVTGGSDPRDIFGKAIIIVNTMPDGEGGTASGV